MAEKIKNKKNNGEPVPSQFRQMFDREGELASMGKIPPQSKELEQSVLGGIIINNELLDIVRGILPRAEMFYFTANQDIYKAMIALKADRQVIDLLTLSEQLKIMGLYDQAGGPYYLAELSTAFSSSESIEFAALKVKENAAKRDMILLTFSVNEQCYDPTTEYEPLLASMQNELIRASNEMYNDAKDVKIDDAFRDMVEDAEKRSEEGHKMSGLPDHIDAYNNLTGGMQRQELEIIAGRPSHGKSARAFQRAYWLATQGYHVGIFSIEMGEKEFMRRFAAFIAEVDILKFKMGTLTQADFDKLAEAMKAIHRVRDNIHLDFRNPITILEIQATCRVWKMKHGLDEFVIDYAQICDSGQPKRNLENRNIEVGYISRGAKRITKELDCHGTLLSQMSRKIEERPMKDKRPYLSDLRESGEIEQDADVVVFIIRKELWMSKDDPEYSKYKGKAEEYIAKQRNGPVGDYTVLFRGAYAKFENYDDKYKSSLPDNDNHPKADAGREPF